MKHWHDQLKQGRPIDDIIDEAVARFKSASSAERRYLHVTLVYLFLKAKRKSEAVQIMDELIERSPDDARLLINMAFLYLDYLKDPEKALVYIDLALPQVYRSGNFRREALGYKARILVKLRRGEQLTEVLEDIMSMQMIEGADDVGRERDFIDRAPAGLIPEDVLARYNQFRPKRAGDGTGKEQPEHELRETDIKPPKSFKDVMHWIMYLQNDLGLPLARVIDIVSDRMRQSGRKDQHDWARNLEGLLWEAGRYSEAALLLDEMIAQYPDDVRLLIRKSSLYLYCLEDPEEALKWIDLAWERANRTGSFRRAVLGDKARILLKLDRGNELSQVLEEIMSVQMIKCVADIGRERDFVDRAPPGVIPDDILARYNEFRPWRKQDETTDEPPKWEPPEWE